MALARPASLSPVPTSVHKAMLLRTALACAALASVRVFAARYEVLVGSPSEEPNSTAARAFVPDLVNATRGDTISFVFAAPWSNHRVVQGIRARACAQDLNGFDSGWRNASQNTTFDIVVQTSAPIWFICLGLQPDGADKRPHWIDGMVGAVNAAPAALTAFRDAAMRLTALPPSLTRTKAKPTSIPTPTSSGEKRGSASKIAVGVTLAFVGVFLTLLWCFCRQQDRKLKRALRAYNPPPMLRVTTHASRTTLNAQTMTQAATATTLASPRESTWRLDLPFIIRESEVSNAPLRPPPPVSIRQRSMEEPDLPRYEDRRADVLLDDAAPAPAAHDAPPPDYARSS